MFYKQFDFFFCELTGPIMRLCEPYTLASICPVVSEEIFENVDTTHTHIRMTEAYIYYKLTNEPKGSGELKMHPLSPPTLFLVTTNFF